jgi:hypothetical protein
MKRYYSSIKFLKFGVKNYVQESVPDKVYLLVRIRQEWVKIVGNSIAFHTSPYSFVNNSLTVHVDDPIWIQELNLRKDDIKANIIKYIPNPGVNLSAIGIKFKNGDITVTPAESKKEEDPLMRLDKATLDKIDSLVAAIEDKKLRDALRSYLIKSSLS